MRFSGCDVLVEGRVLKDEVLGALARAMDVDPGRVAVICDVVDYPEREVADVVCVMSSVEGSYGSLLSIQVDPRDAPELLEIRLGTALAEFLGRVCLVPDSSPNPFQFWVLRPGARPLVGSLDPDAMEVNRYELLSVVQPDASVDVHGEMQGRGIHSVVPPRVGQPDEAPAGDGGRVRESGGGGGPADKV